MPLEFANTLRYTDPKRFYKMKAMAYAHYWQGTIPVNEDERKMLKYVEFLEDDANRLYKQMKERM